MVLKKRSWEMSPPKAKPTSPLPPEVEGFLGYLKNEKDFSPLTLKSYRQDLNQFFRFASASRQQGTSAHGRYNYRDMQPALIRAFLADLHRRKNSPATVERKLSVLRSFFKFLVREGWTQKNIAELVPAPKKPSRTPRFLNVDEAFGLLDSLDPSSDHYLRDRAMLELFYSSGLRAAEMHGLDVENLDLHAGTVRVLGKGRKERVVPVGGRAAEALKELVKQLGRDHGPLFTARGDDRMSIRTIYNIVSRRGRSAGLPKRLHPHMLRHTFATHILNGGADLRSIQEMMGHASINTTEKYTHVGLDRLMEVYDKAHPHAKRK